MIKKVQDVYDYVVIGAGLSGLTLARALSQEGASVRILEKNSQIGGFLQRPTTSFVADSELNNKALTWISKLAGVPLVCESHSNHPQTYESPALRDFVGFGDSPPSFYEEISYFLNSKELVVPTSFWLEALGGLRQGLEIDLNAEVTAFEMAEDQSLRAVVNGQKMISARNWIWTGSLSSLPLLFSDQVLPPKQKQKLSKGLHWISVTVLFEHSTPVAETSRLCVLNGTTTDDFGPCVGRFTSPHSSTWTSFLDHQEAEDSEQIALLIRKIKKQVKRAFPQALGETTRERIVVNEDYSSETTFKPSASQTLPGLENFWLASGSLHTQKNWSGAFAQLLMVASSLGLRTDLFQEPQTQDQEPKVAQSESPHKETDVAL